MAFAVVSPNYFLFMTRGSVITVVWPCLNPHLAYPLFDITKLHQRSSLSLLVNKITMTVTMFHLPNSFICFWDLGDYYMWTLHKCWQRVSQVTMAASSGHSTPVCWANLYFYPSSSRFLKMVHQFFYYSNFPCTSGI